MKNPQNRNVLAKPFSQNSAKTFRFCGFFMAIVYSRQLILDVLERKNYIHDTLTSTVNNLHLKRRRRNGGPVPDMNAATELAMQSSG